MHPSGFLRATVALGLGLLVLFVAGCSSTGPTLLVRYSTALAPTSPRPLPELNTNRVEPAFVPAEAERLSTRPQQLFAAARTAYTARETEAAVEHLRTLMELPSSPFPKVFLQSLVVQCYEEANEWAHAAATARKFGLHRVDPTRVALAEALAEHPRGTIAFAGNAPAIPFTLSAGQLVFARAEINGQSGRFLFDTGFSRSMLSPAFAGRAGIRPLSPKVRLTDSNQRAKSVGMGVAAQLNVGGVTARQIPVVISTVAFLEKIEAGVDGVIGWDLLQETDVTFDFVSQRMWLKEPGPIPAEKPNLAGRKAPILTVTSAEGRPLDLFLDTGYVSKPIGINLVSNAGLLATRIDVGQFRRNWRPSVSRGMFSLRLRWPRLKREFVFAMDGTQITVPVARIFSRTSVLEGFQTSDGMVGNGPFLGGTLRLIGPHRLALFEPGAMAGPEPAR